MLSIICLQSYKEPILKDIVAIVTPDSRVLTHFDATEYIINGGEYIPVPRDSLKYQAKLLPVLYWVSDKGVILEQPLGLVVANQLMHR